MNRLKADLHIHSVLSACSSLSMSPSRIIEEALKKDLDIIAITDHNSAMNCRTASEIGKEKNILVIPGMEVTVLEEFHVVVLFPDIEKAETFSEFIYDMLLPLEIDEEKIGYQLVVDKDENITRFEKRILNQASVSVDELVEKVEEFGGIFFFAHIDKSYYSLIASLGFIPPKWKHCIFEITKDDDMGLGKIIRNSDAHVPEDVGHRYFFLECEKSIQSVFENLRNGVIYHDA